MLIQLTFGYDFFIVAPFFSTQLGDVNKYIIIIISYIFVKMIEAQMADIQFYLLKISRLESDLAATQNELMNARLRLRTAQDYQIKYQLLLKQTEQETERARMYSREEESKIAELITIKVDDRDQYWSQKISKLQKQASDKHIKQINKISQQFANFRKKHEKCGNKFDDQDILAFKNKKLQKENEALEEKILQMKRQFQRRRQQQVKNLKQSMQQKSKQKQENERKIYRQKIQSLEKTIQSLQDGMVQAKAKADPERQKQIDKLKVQLNLQLQKSNQQLNKLNESFKQKNKQIQGVLNDKIRIQQNLLKEKKQLRDYIKSLQDKLFQKEKQHEIQLINLKQRMSRIRQQEAQGLKQQIHKIQQAFNQQQNSWKIIIKDKDSQIERMKNKHDEQTQRHKDDKGKQLNKIQELKDRLKQYQGQKEAGETQQLIKSMKDMESKQQNFNNYQNGVTFLDRQLKKAIAKIQQKNIEITKLLKQLNQVRKQNQQQINELKQRNRKDKKYFNDKILQLEDQIRQLNQQIRSKERDHKKKQRDLESKLSQLNKQNSSLKQLVQQMQRDYTRIIQTKKGLENSYRQERQKGLTSKSDLTMVKKQKWLEMQRQKNQLEAIFKQKEQQLKNKHEIQSEKLRHQRDELRTQNEILKGQLQSARKQSGDDDKQNKKGVYSQFHKKMATLNLQIALTKNIYDSLVQAKSRKPKDSRISQFDRIDEDASNSQHNDDSLKESKPPQFFNLPGFQKLGMSFNPNQK